tara:strand:- start:58 stop:165 length:108 start_codon:yes stop_codon:yes gene_type:complete
MKDTSQWLIALIGLPTAACFVWFSISGSDFKDGFE